MDTARTLFERARAIDLGPDMKSSDEGIHAASLGGVWQCCVLGYCGIRLCGDQLRIVPNLPENWDSAAVKIWWRGSQLEITATHHHVQGSVLQGKRDLEILNCYGTVRGTDSLAWEYGKRGREDNRL